MVIELILPCRRWRRVHAVLSNRWHRLLDENRRQAAVQFHHVATEGILCAKSECLFFCQSLQLAWQVAHSWHASSTHKNGNDGYPTCESSRELNAHDILGIIETKRAATGSDPGRTHKDQDDHHG